jgi:hypothetical protein
VLVAYGTVIALRSRARWLIVLHPVATLAAIVVTANHFWMDAIVAGGLIVAALAVLPAHRRAPQPVPAPVSPGA